MLISLYTLSEKYRDKKVIIYGVNHTSVTFFTDLAVNHQVNVSSFWDADDKFMRETFANRQIINTNQLQDIEETVKCRL